MGNPNHDPKTGEFTEGASGDGGTAGVSPEAHDASKHATISLAGKRAENMIAFDRGQFENKIAASKGLPQTDHPLPHPGVEYKGLSSSQHAAMLKEALKRR